MKKAGWISIVSIVIGIVVFLTGAIMGGLEGFAFLPF